MLLRKVHVVTGFGGEPTLKIACGPCRCVLNNYDEDHLEKSSQTSYTASWKGDRSFSSLYFVASLSQASR